MENIICDKYYLQSFECNNETYVSKDGGVHLKVIGRSGRVFRGYNKIFSIKDKKQLLSNREAV